MPRREKQTLQLRVEKNMIKNLIYDTDEQA